MDWFSETLQTFSVFCPDSTTKFDPWLASHRQHLVSKCKSTVSSKWRACALVSVRVLAEYGKCVHLGFLRVCRDEWEGLRKVLKEAEAPRPYQHRRETVTPLSLWVKMLLEFSSRAVAERLPYNSWSWWRTQLHGQQPNREVSKANDPRLLCPSLPSPASASHCLNSPGIQKTRDPGQCTPCPSASQGAELGRKGWSLDPKREMGNKSPLSRLQVRRCGWRHELLTSSFFLPAFALAHLSWEDHTSLLHGLRSFHPFCFILWDVSRKCCKPQWFELPSVRCCPPTFQHYKNMPRITTSSKIMKPCRADMNLSCYIGFCSAWCVCGGAQSRSTQQSLSHRLIGLKRNSIVVGLCDLGLFVMQHSLSQSWLIKKTSVF